MSATKQADTYREIAHTVKRVTAYAYGYSTTNTELNERFRKVRITVSPDLAAKLDYRQGYYGGKKVSKFNAFDKERQR